MTEEITNNTLTQAEEVDRLYPGFAHIGCRKANAKKSKALGMTKYLFEDGSSIIVGQQKYYILGKGVSLYECLWEGWYSNIQRIFSRCLHKIKISFTTKDGAKQMLKNALCLVIGFLILYAMWGQDPEIWADRAR